MPSANSRKFDSLLLLAFFFLILWILHFPLLRLPYFWDEAGYYIPAARDLYLTGALIPLAAGLLLNIGQTRPIVMANDAFE